MRIKRCKLYPRPHSSRKKGNRFCLCWLAHKVATKWPPSGPQGQPDQPTNVLLLNRDGRILEESPDTDANGLTQLVDVNHDQLSELLLARFASVELQGLGISASTFASEWEYPFFSPPTAVLTTDLTQDGIDEILIGTEDGRIHRLNQAGDTHWIIAPGSSVSHLGKIVERK